MLPSTIMKRVYHDTILKSCNSNSIRKATTLVIAEPTSDSYLSASTLSTISAAQHFSGPITLLTNKAIDKASIPSSVTNIIKTDLKDSLAESVSEAVKMAQEEADGGRYSHILAPATKFGSNVLPRVAAVLKSSPISDIIQIISEDTFVSYDEVTDTVFT